MFSRLVTKEDPSHIHKALGIACLLHYVYQFSRYALGYSILTRASTVIFAICLHFSLNLSSFIFRVPKLRFTKPIIWNEFRAHNLLFTFRSCAVMGLNLIAPETHFYKCLVLFYVMIMADIITSWTNTKTTRNMPYWEGCSENREQFHKFYYAVSQFEATFACLSRSPVSPFIVMMPIQISSILMTLVRKNIISTYIWHLLYTISLAIPDLLYFRDPVFIFLVFPISIVGVCLRKQNISKYLIWSVICIGYMIIY